jgi:hypothetical protein
MRMTLDITSGPSKADLLRSVTNVTKGLTTTFETNDGPLEAQIQSLDESPNGIEFLVSGFATSKALSGVPFTGAYNIESKLGRLDFGDASEDAANETPYSLSRSASTHIPLYLFQSGDSDVYAYSLDPTGANIPPTTLKDPWLLRGTIGDVQTGVPAQHLDLMGDMLARQGYFVFQQAMANNDQH